MNIVEVQEVMGVRKIDFKVGSGLLSWSLSTLQAS